jgi:glyoxylase-like metal-dependent hydrolase (beta-lactamase superfamily II)
MSLHWGGPEVVLEHHPGPTPGAIWTVIPSQHVIYVGDSVVINQPPFLANADLVTWMEGLNLLLTDYREFVIVAGRGGLAARDAVKAQLSFLKDVVKGMEKLSKQAAPPEATEDLIRRLLSNFSYSPELAPRYTQRLRHGLYQYYARRYRPTSSPEQPRMEENEQ